MRRALLVVALLALHSGPAIAHGPTVAVGSEGPEPRQITVRAGATIHFRNGADAPRTLVGEGPLREPTILAPAGDAHVVYPDAGWYAYRILEAPGQGGTVVVTGP